MKKTKISAKPVLKFLRELSVIVTGIVITVGLGLWVNKKNNDKDLKLYLDAITMELEENADKLDLYSKWLQKSVRYANYLKSNDKNSLQKDSLGFYSSSIDPRNFTEELFENGYGCGYMNMASCTDMFTTYSFESLKTSGLLRQIKDKELLSSIWEAYSRLEQVIHNIDRNFQIKGDESMKEQQLLAEGKTVAVPMQVFYSTDIPITMAGSCQITSKILRETITKLDDAIAGNKKNKDKELKQYLAAVTSELEENVNKFDRYSKWLQKSVGYANYLKLNDSIHKDSLDYYSRSVDFASYTDDNIDEGCGYMNTNSFIDMFTTESFERLNISGLLPRIKDKTLIKSMGVTYGDIEYVKQHLDRCFQIKEGERMKEQQLLAEGQTVAVPMQAFYSTDMPVSMIQNCQLISAYIKKTITKLDDALMVNKNNDKELKQHLATVTRELEENVNKLDRYSRWLQKSVRYADYLKSNDNIHKDSLAYYSHSVDFASYTDDNIAEGCGYTNTNSFIDMFMTDAFEGLKYYGFLRQIKDKELLSSMWEAYSQLEQVKKNLDRCFQIKEGERIKELQLLADGKTVAVPMQVFYATDMPEAMVRWCQNASEVIKETITILKP